MSNRYHASGGDRIPAHIHDSQTGKWWARPGYWPVEARQVCDWLNGKDQPLTAVMVDRSADPYDPSVRRGRGTRGNGK